MANWHTIKRIKARSINASIRAKRRWQLDRNRRDKLAAQQPRLDLTILRRIIVIECERIHREVTIYACDRPADIRRKMRAADL